MSLRSIAVFALLLTLVLVSNVGCTSPGPARLDTTTAGVSDTAGTLRAGGVSMDRVARAMDAMQPGNRLPQQFNEFSNSVNELDRSAARVRARNAAMNTRAAEHLRAWERELTGISGDTAREISSQRRDAFQARFDSVRSRMTDLKNAFDPYMSSLHDLRLVLANELNAKGLDAARPLMASTTEKAGTVRRTLDAAMTELNAAQDAIATRGGN